MAFAGIVAIGLAPPSVASTLARARCCVSALQVTWLACRVEATSRLPFVAELKRQPGRELQIHGSPNLAQSLLAAGLIDELRLLIAPVVGSGRRLFPERGAPAGLRLLSNEASSGGVAAHVYESTGLPEYGTYVSGA